VRQLTVPPVSLHGTWADHTDIRPTLLALVGLKDDYVGDGRVVSEDLTIRPGATSSPLFEAEAVCYKQLNSGVGTFGTDVIQADTAALKTGSAAGDQLYQTFLTRLQAIGSARDKLAGQMKQELWNAEFNGTPLGGAGVLHAFECGVLLAAADLGAHA
jgi:hypothetical protein